MGSPARLTPTDDACLEATTPGLGDPLCSPTGPKNPLGQKLVSSTFSTVDLRRLFKLRLVVARYGEMDGARWWNTKGVLGPKGSFVLKRGFPATHQFTQARVVFEVAESRCRELFHPPGCMTLWNLPAELEEQFQEQWQTWLDEKDTWTPVFDAIQGHTGGDLLTALGQLELISSAQIEQVKKLKRSAEGRAVPISGTYEPNDEILTLLAGGFARGEPGQPAVPYARLEESA